MTRPLILFSWIRRGGYLSVPRQKKPSIKYMRGPWRGGNLPLPQKIRSIYRRCTVKKKKKKKKKWKNKINSPCIVADGATTAIGRSRSLFTVYSRPSYVRRPLPSWAIVTSLPPSRGELAGPILQYLYFSMLKPRYTINYINKLWSSVTISYSRTFTKTKHK